MSSPELRTSQLQQIPVFALRNRILALADDLDVDEMVNRVEKTVHIKSRNIGSTIERLTREQLIQLIVICPEFTDEEITSLFEEYRYGANPSFSIYLLGGEAHNLDDLTAFRKYIEKDLEDFNHARERDLPICKGIVLNDLSTLPEHNEVVEGNYRFLQRLDYIDENQTAISTYETLYGFFWLNKTDGYAIIQSQNSTILSTLKFALESAAKITLTSLVISKRLKANLPFLSRNSMRSGRLYNPFPDASNFRSITIADDNPYAKGYEELENAYPEVRQARYRENIDDERETSLIIQANTGTLRILGRFKASEFRTWCLGRLSELKGTLSGFQGQVDIYLENLNLKKTPQMARLKSAKQKELAIELIKALLITKQSNLQTYTLPMSPLVVAAGLEQYVIIQIPFQCESPNCNEEGLLACPQCGRNVFMLKQSDDNWNIECLEHRHNRWIGNMPIQGQCEQGHDFSIESLYLETNIEIIPSEDLLILIRDVVQTHIRDHSFDYEKESFYIRGNTLYFASSKAELFYTTERQSKNYYVSGNNNIITGDVKGIGITIGHEATTSVN